ncbi:distal tail protein Dit [Streptococcus thermophilus]|nr:phage tail protein [Streptococcus thermophilus]
MALFQFNGYDLTNYFKLIKVEHEIGNERSISTDSAPAIGVNVQNVDIGAKKIKLTVSLATRDLADMTFIDPNEPAQVDNVQFYRVREEAARILHTKKAVKLFLPTEPDRYYLALVKGEVNLKGISDWYDEATIEFLVPDGVAHSTTYKRVTDYREEDGKMIFSIDNEGSTDAYPIITLKANSDNGYYGLVSDKFAFEAGDTEEVDAEPYKHSEILLDYASYDWITKALSDGKKNVAILNDTTQSLNGTLGIENVWGRPHLVLTNRGSGLMNKAASLTFDIPADSTGERGALNEYIWWRQIFWVNPADQVGFIKISFSSESGEFLYGVETIKRGNGLTTEYNLLTSNGMGGYNLRNLGTFWATHHPHENPFYKDGGQSDLQRHNDEIQVFWRGSYPKFTVPEIRDKKSAQVHIALGALDDRPLPTHMYVDAFVYAKHFVTSMKDIPNRYFQGSSLVINSETDTVYLNDLPNLDQIVDGSMWPVFPPGQSELEIIQSYWAKKNPSVTIEFEERWI